MKKKQQKVSCIATTWHFVIVLNALHLDSAWDLTVMASMSDVVVQKHQWKQVTYELNDHNISPPHRWMHPTNRDK